VSPPWTTAAIRLPPEYIAAFEKMANLAIKAAVEGQMKISIKTPLIHLKKSEIIRKGIALGVDYGLTHSCYIRRAEKGLRSVRQLPLAGKRVSGSRHPRPDALLNKGTVLFI